MSKLTSKIEGDKHIVLIAMARIAHTSKS